MTVLPTMLSWSPEPSLMSCPHCGEPRSRELDDGHVCVLEQRYDYELIKLHYEGKRLEHEMAAWLDSPEGRFAQFCAERERLSSPARS